MSMPRCLSIRMLGWGTCLLGGTSSCDEYMPSASHAHAGRAGTELGAASATTLVNLSTLAGAAAGAAPTSPVESSGGDGGGGVTGATVGGSSGAQVAGAPTTLTGESGTAGVASTTVATATVTLQPATTYQTLEGFGAALAWYLSSLTGHAKRDELYRILFADLGLDILRFRNTFGRSEFGEAVKEKAVLDAATVSLGRRPKVLMTSWSPPAALKANAVETCSGEASCTLKKNAESYAYAEFADYWLDALTAYGNAGVVPDWVSIQNEPDYIPSGWEGCKFAATESTSYPSYGTALAAVSAKLGSLSERPKLIGPEVLGIHWNRMETYLPALDTQLLWAAAHHLYERGSDEIWDWLSPGPDSFLTPMQSAKSAAGALPILQTEFQTDEDQGTLGGFETAWLIHNSLVTEGVSAWLYWDLVWGAGHGLVSLPDTNSYALRDQYYSLRHYALFTDPGDVRVGASASKTSLRVSAFRSPDQRRITVIVLNTGSSAESVGLDWGTLTPTSTEIYRTAYIPGNSERWLSQPALSVGSTLTLPSRAVSTVVMHL